MKRSLRRTLAVRFAATMAVGLTVMCSAIWWAASRVLRHQLDQSISASAFLVANELSSSAQCVEGAHTLALNAIRYGQEINRYVVFRDPHCAAIRAIPSWAMDLPGDSAALASARGGVQSFSDARWHGMAVRSAYIAVPTDGEGEADRVVQVAASLDPVRALEQVMLVVLLGIVFLGTAATLVGGWSLAGSAVRPVMEITEQATHIEAGTLDQRLSAHATADEYRGLVGVLNRMLDRLGGSFATQRRFSADVSHELRTPLTALRGEIEVALRADRNPREYQRVLHSALEEIDRMTTMTEELLLISRAEAGLIAPQREPLDVDRVVASALERLRHRIEDKELRVEHVTAPSNGCSARLDRALLTRLVDELLENAVNYSDPGGRIIVRNEHLDDRVRLVVEDTGPGIGAKDLPHLFEPYYRADLARTRGAGTGLGLTSAAAIARLHGGEIRAANRSEGGARFEVDFPTS
ncbi:MAG TPA: ATP-binding protein [Gemmatimonadales bacterium]|nr:ATP-binding protein [Gemmatimonadales bacterium]